MKKSRINPISRKRREQMPEYKGLITLLRDMCHNKSELSGAKPDWQTEGKVEPHHIGGRTGKLFLDAFNIIMLVRDEHDTTKLQAIGKEKLYEIVARIRNRQGFTKEEK